jgi:multiple sugar transport system permease protein
MATATLPEKATKSYKLQLIFQRIYCYFILSLLVLICIFPLWTLIIDMTRNNGQLQGGFSWWFGTNFIANMQKTFSDSHLPVGTALRNSFIVSLFTALLSCYFSCLTAFVFNVYTFKGKKYIFTAILLIMMIPTQVSALGFVQVMRAWGLTNNLLPLIVPSICSPIVFFYINQYMESILPFELVEAGRADGCSEIGIFHRIVIPIMKPALAVQFIFTFVSSWNNYFVPALLIDKPGVETLPLIIASLKASDPASFDLGKVYCLIGVSIIPLVIVYLVFSRFILKGMTEGAVKG